MMGVIAQPFTLNVSLSFLIVAVIVFPILILSEKYLSSAGMYNDSPFADKYFLEIMKKKPNGEI